MLASEEVDLDVIFSDLSETVMGEAQVVVDDHPVLCCTMTYTGVEFASGSDPARWPFTVARSEWSTEPWPVLAGPKSLNAAHSDIRAV